MLEIIYLLLFTLFSAIFIFLKSVKHDEFKITNQKIKQLANYGIYIKGIPALLAALFVFLIRPDNSLFYIVLASALIFCLAGDLGMEKGLIPGLPIFLVAQILFSSAFIGQSLTNGFTADSYIVTGIIFVCIVLYITLFVRYLNSSETGLGKFKVPVIIYCAAISLMFISTGLLWTTLGFLGYPEFLLIPLGGFLFIFSDSVIALREFRGRKFSKDILVVMLTYFCAIFLLSLSGILVK
ncbi:MAG: lysoplasmalogenase family protein [Candidatus Hodarchaeales archaeon]|jgi:uncharacterized membrane protein YhhN